MTRTAAKTPRAAPSSDVATLRASIGAMTGVIPSSSDPRYLRQRIRQIESKLAAGDDVRHRPASFAIMSVSMPTSAKAALDRIVAREKCGTSDLVRRGLAVWARQHGYKAEAQEIEG